MRIIPRDEVGEVLSDISRRKASAQVYLRPMTPLEQWGKEPLAWRAFFVDSDRNIALLSSGEPDHNWITPERDRMTHFHTARNMVCRCATEDDEELQDLVQKIGWSWL